MKSLFSGIIIMGLMLFPITTLVASNDQPILIANRPSAQGNATIIKQTWRIIPNYYGDRGAIEYSFVVKNLTKRDIEALKYEVVSYDSSGNIVTSSDRFVEAIPAGKTRASTRRLDYYGGETTLKISLIDIDFAN
ncbi:MAG: hypothetical protein EWV53_08345 [Microcystis panniformis Mp_MB_F_20051200_S9]|uniref:Uncharacterized protein n=1 Tax=Microcystis panniformis Mp_MB_F_20051200_S9 TaxID=2486223 RepID=A0A552Q2X8_9CHRO|nr:MAG: hypothetical protein EWV42_15415 [Microcystis panniformis Mp_GB_SS_20050300_S99D]TRV50312.1 MAG: hypothetical protein EWV87_08810 [Microcystis panniformis Mp_GB_SS_20050300_S99]TRV52934.1 MAG: hypothetical protein EWV43_01120 [Microcystis panniformis Mp_MB_F_20080800_S26D]TRV63574.1 MAG: hypothetical protein EWV53_08345 [Microcystis panniformis Mp_MB_F_20051200_S9]TRV63795.1 MAG: hypothetical protein EWV69_03000 [Microcystis panniformis Mp_MB_F_20080800_S26]TRV66208.1 MAG: hypothetical